MSELRSATDWLQIAEGSSEWRAVFEKDKQRYIQLSDITGRPQIDGNGAGRGWEGEIIVPRAMAIEMMAWLEKRARDELKKLGVTK